MVCMSVALDTETVSPESNGRGYTTRSGSTATGYGGISTGSGNNTADTSKTEMWMTLQALTAFLVIITVMAFAFILRPVLQANVVAHRDEYAPV